MATRRQETIDREAELTGLAMLAGTKFFARRVEEMVIQAVNGMPSDPAATVQWALQLQAKKELLLALDSEARAAVASLATEQNGDYE